MGNTSGWGTARSEIWIKHELGRIKLRGLDQWKYCEYFIEDPVFDEDVATTGRSLKSCMDRSYLIQWIWENKRLWTKQEARMVDNIRSEKCKHGGKPILTSELTIHEITAILDSTRESFAWF